MSEKLKILVLNPSSKDINKAVKVTNSQQKKAGPFSFSIYLGDVCSKTPQELKYTPDIPIYYSEGENEVNENKLNGESFTYLGDIGRFKASNGLIIGFVNGHIDDKVSSDEIVRKLCSNEPKKRIDILITYMWPEAIAKEEKLVLCGDVKLDKIITQIRPRYWFACGGEKGRFFEREPYKIDNDITRFISLATFNEGRWWYAFNIDLNTNDTGVVKLGKTPILDTEESSQKRRLVEDIESSNGTLLPKKPKTKPLVRTRANCFLCLSNPNFEKHMIITVGKYTFLTISKGPLTTREELGFSGHGLIIPFGHYPTLQSTPDCQDGVHKSDICDEIVKFQDSLVQMFRSLGSYSVCFWEISRKRGVHFHNQFVPVSDNLVSLFEAALINQIEFEKQFNSEPITYKKYTEDNFNKEIYNKEDSEDHVLFTIYGKEGRTKYMIPLGTDENRYFDAQFPRKVLAVLLNLKHRIHWNKIIETEEEEASQKEIFRKKFKPFNFVLQKFPE